MHENRETPDLKRPECWLANLGQDAASAEHSLQELLHKMPVPVLVSRVADGQIMYANQRFHELLGLDRSDLSRRDLSSFIPRLADRRKLAHRLAKDNCVQNVEVEGRREDGSRLWLSAWQERAVCDGCECLITILVDVTEQRLAESQLQQGQEDLQHLLELSDRDREVIAYEIHDGVVQEMTGALMFLEVARRAVERGEPGALDQLQTVARLLKDGIQEARRLMDGVRLPDLDKEGLHGALQALAKKVTETAGIAIELEYGVAARDLPLATEKAIYRMVQECLNNVRRHSRSPRARVELTQHGEHLEIRVRDWGVGFNPARVAKDALGLKGLRQRAQLLGGSVEIRQPPDKGTEIRIEFPLGPRTCLS